MLLYLMLRVYVVKEDWSLPICDEFRVVSLELNILVFLMLQLPLSKSVVCKSNWLRWIVCFWVPVAPNEMTFFCEIVIIHPSICVSYEFLFWEVLWIRRFRWLRVFCGRTNVNILIVLFLCCFWIFLEWFCFF